MAEEKTVADVVCDKLTTGALDFIRHTLLKPAVVGGIVSLVLVISLPWAHLGILYTPWNIYKETVDQQFCKNYCWDTLFKGNYEFFPGGYKHIYFNLTSNTLIIWIFSAITIVALYETVKHLIVLFCYGQLRLLFAGLFLVSLYSNYYSWWAYFNYYNDDFYDQWLHQLVFTITELLSTISVVHLCNSKNPYQWRILLLIVSVSLFHICASAKDQFINNVIMGQADDHQIVRDIGLMVGDVVHLGVSGLALKQVMKPTAFKNDVMFACGTVLACLLITSIL